MTSKTRNILSFLGIVALAILALTISANASDARTATWDGGGADALASTAANWDLDTAPIAGDDILINSGSKAITWDINAELGAFTIAAGYTGTITQSCDMHTMDFIIGAGVFTGNANNLYCNGSFLHNGGTITTFKTNLKLISNGNLKTTHYIGSIEIYDGCNYNSVGNVYIGNYFKNCGNLTINTGHKFLLLSQSYTFTYFNGGIINVNGTLELRIYYADRQYPYSVGNVSGNGKIVFSNNNANITHTWTESILFNGTIEFRSETSNYCTINLNGCLLTTNAIIVGARAIVTNSAVVVSTISCSSFDSSNAAASFIGTNIYLVLTGSGSLKLKATDHVELLSIQANTINLTGTASVTGDLSFTDRTASHPYGLYINGTRTSSVTTTSSGTYSLGSGVFAWDNATLKITPVISYDEWGHDDGGSATNIWVGYHYWLGYVADDDVTWELTDGPSWLYLYSGGIIAGIPTNVGNYSYNISATATNGEVATYSNYIYVEEFLPDPDWTDNPGEGIIISTPILFVLGDVDLIMWDMYDPYYIEVTNDTLIMGTVAGEYLMTFWTTSDVELNVTTFAPYHDTIFRAIITGTGGDLQCRFGGFQPGAVYLVTTNSLSYTVTADGAGYIIFSMENVVSDTVTLTMKSTPPMFATSPDIVANELVWYTYQVGIYPSDATVTAVELPYWIYWDAEAMYMAGLPRDLGTFEVRLRADNADGTTWQNWTIYIYSQDIGFTSSPDLTITKFDNYLYEVDFYPPGAVLKCLVKPTWLHLNEYTDTLDGYANRAGSFDVVLRITIGHAVAYQNFTITVNDVDSPPDWKDTPSFMDINKALFYILIAAGVAFILLVFYMRRS